MHVVSVHYQCMMFTHIEDTDYAPRGLRGCDCHILGEWVGWLLLNVMYLLALL